MFGKKNLTPLVAMAAFIAAISASAPPTAHTFDLASTDPLAGNFQNQIAGAGATSGIPETSTWAMMLIGFGLIGLQLRRRQPAEVTA